jgi:hypothetical protein
MNELYGDLPPLNNQVEERFLAPLRDPFRGSRSKASPTRPSVSDPIKERSVSFCPTGWVPEEASSAQPFRGLLLMLQGETGVSRSREVNPDCLNTGLMKPRKGFTPVMGNKNWGRARLFGLPRSRGKKIGGDLLPLQG